MSHLASVVIHLENVVMGSKGSRPTCSALDIDFLEFDRIESMKNKRNECCPRFNPDKWDKKIFSWNSKMFIKESVPTLFHTPFPPMIGKKISKMMNLATRANRIDVKKR